MKATPVILALFGVGALAIGVATAAWSDEPATIEWRSDLAAATAEAAAAGKPLFVLFRCPP